MSKLKSIWDAVNELRGDLSLSEHEMHHTHLASCRSGLSLYSVYASDTRSELVVCAIAEFNALVEEMTLGLDVNPVTKYKFSEYLHNPKILLEKDSIVNKPLVYTQEMADNGELPSVGMKVMLEEDTDFFSCASGEIKTLKANDIVYVVAIGNRSDNNATVITLMKQGAGFCTINHDYIKPIDQRTKKEKAIDEIFNNSVWDNSIELLGLAYDEWVGE